MRIAITVEYEEDEKKNFVLGYKIVKLNKEEILKALKALTYKTFENIDEQKKKYKLNDIVIEYTEERK
jgi:6-pyruvoyl-tetrahydropterin synthase